jgi:hypothetical protein
MARINNLTNFLTDVATAIKNKKGSETPIPAADFDTEITNLPSQGVYQTKTTTITQNGTTTVTPDTGYDAIEQLDITVNVPLQSKTYTFTQNATTTIVPDQGYAGFSQVGLEINVPGTDTSDANAIASDIEENKTAYVNGVKITGNLPLITGTVITGAELEDITETCDGIEIKWPFTNKTIMAANSGVAKDIDFDTLATFLQVTPNQIKTGEKVLGVTGTYDGVISQPEYDEVEATLDDLLTGEYKEVYNVMNEVTDTPEDNYNGVGGTPTQIENKIDALLGVNN